MDFNKVLQYSSELNILYVEDNEILLEATTEILEDFFTMVFWLYLSCDRCYYVEIKSNFF